ncbi:MAG: SMC-Scp complex subunit ScpB, partial [Bryobacteraceae bacterium]
LDELVAEYEKPGHGVTLRQVAGGYKMTTKAEHHETIRTFVKNLKPPLKLSLPALETLALIAYKQPITAPEIMEVRGVQGAGVLKTLLDRKLIVTAGRKNVIGRPMLYKTTRDFLVQFGLKDLNELPTLKEFEELGRLAISDEPLSDEASPATETSAGELFAEPAAEAPNAEPAEATVPETSEIGDAPAPAEETVAEESPAESVAAESSAEPAAEESADEPVDGEASGEPAAEAAAEIPEPENAVLSSEKGEEVTPE